MNRTFTRAILLATFWMALAMAGCGVFHHNPSAWMYPAPPLVPSVAPVVADVSAHVQSAATADSNAAGTIRSSAIDGKAHTPADVLPVLSQDWDAILAGANQVQNTAQDLSALKQQMDALGAQVAAKDSETTALRTSLASANGAITAEHDARVKAEQAEAQAKSDQAAHLERLLFGVAITSLLGLGAAVTIGLLMHDIRISIAGGAGCLAMALGCFLLGEVIQYWFWILAGLGAVAVLLAVYEFVANRQQILAAFKTTPLVVPPSGGVASKTA